MNAMLLSAVRDAIRLLDGEDDLNADLAKRSHRNGVELWTMDAVRCQTIADRLKEGLRLERGRERAVSARS